ncbi:MAG: hypothetical protein ACLQD8_00515 [Thermoplasmata archaeon]
MVDSGQCELHEATILIGSGESEALLRLGRSPLGDECQRCHVCLSAREYVQRRLDELSGRVLPPEQSSQVAWRQLQAAVASAKTSIHRPA